MLRRGAPCRDTSRIIYLPPVELHDLRSAPFLQEFTHPDWREPFCVREPGNESTRGSTIEMIVMVVRNENGVDGRKLVKGQTGCRVTSRPGKLNRGSPGAPDRIGKDADSLRLNEEGAVAYPGNGESGIVGTDSGRDRGGSTGSLTDGSLPAPRQHPLQQISRTVRLRQWPRITKSTARMVVSYDAGDLRKLRLV